MIRPYLKAINILLSILILFLVSKIYSVWEASEAREFSATAIQAEALVRVPELSDPQNPPRKIYRDVVEKDLFRPERTEWVPPSMPKQEETPQIAEPDIRVYGIVISDDLKIALVKEQAKTVKTVRRGRQSKLQVVASNKLQKIKEGDSIKGWRVSAIEAETVVLRSGESSKEFHLIEPNDPKARVIPSHLQIKPHKKRAAQPQPEQAGSKGRPPVPQPKKRKK